MGFNTQFACAHIFIAVLHFQQCKHLKHIQTHVCFEHALILYWVLQEVHLFMVPGMKNDTKGVIISSCYYLYFYSVGCSFQCTQYPERSSVEVPPGTIPKFAKNDTYQFSCEWQKLIFCALKRTPSKIENCPQSTLKPPKSYFVQMYSLINQCSAM